MSSITSLSMRDLIDLWPSGIRGELTRRAAIANKPVSEVVAEELGLQQQQSVVAVTPLYVKAKRILEGGLPSHMDNPERAKDWLESLIQDKREWNDLSEGEKRLWKAIQAKLYEAR